MFIFHIEYMRTIEKKSDNQNWFERCATYNEKKYQQKPQIEVSVQGFFRLNFSMNHPFHISTGYKSWALTSVNFSFAWPICLMTDICLSNERIAKDILKLLSNQRQAN